MPLPPWSLRDLTKGCRGDFKQPSMPNSDIIGFVRNVNAEPGFCINVMWVNEKQVRRYL